jgi:hypothetical protein
MTTTTIRSREDRVTRWRDAVALSTDRTVTLNDRIEACLGNAVDSIADGEPEEAVAWASMAATLTVRRY